MSQSDPIFLAIRDVLLNDWDPHNAARLPESTAVYDLYIPPLIDLLHNNAGEERIIEWLHEREQESMCFPSLGTQRLQRIAIKLRDLGAAM